MQIPSFRPKTATEINLGRVDGWPSNRGVARHEPPHRAARVVSSPGAWYVVTQISLSPEMVGGPVCGGARASPANPAAASCNTSGAGNMI